MKQILGLDLGTSSIGWALIEENENETEESSIINAGVRTIRYENFVNSDTGKESKSPETDFIGGKSISPNAARTKARSARRNLQRYKLRRANLIECLKLNSIINDSDILAEDGNSSTFNTYINRALAPSQKIELEEFARILLQINKKRGYKSSRKAKSSDEGQLIDGMSIAMKLYEENLTPGEFVLNLLESGKKYIPEFYASDLRNEFDRVWETQKQFYPEILTDSLKKLLHGKNKGQTWAICKEPFNIVGIKRQTKGFEQKVENYKWRVEVLDKQIELENLAIVLQEINNQLSNTSNHLGAISDRSKELYFNNMTVGQYQMAQLSKNPNYSLKNQIFYRQDYLDEFEKIWEMQSQFYPQLTDKLKYEIRDIIIFYQRPLKSQKGLVSFCEFESREVIIGDKNKKKINGLKVAPKSSPLFQDFKIWQILNNIEIKGRILEDKDCELNLFGEIDTKTLKVGKRPLYQEEKDILFSELSIKDSLSSKEALEIVFKNHKELSMNFTKLEGNRTQASLFKAYQQIIEMSGHGEYNFAKMRAKDIFEVVKNVFNGLNFNTDILRFNSCLEGDSFEKQPLFKLWHLLYSFEGDKSKSGKDTLIDRIHKLYGFDKEYAVVLSEVTFQDDYGSLSAKAMRKIMPYLIDGNTYSLACEYAGYRHSQRSLTKNELDNKQYCDKLELLPNNSLRNPVVEKIINQMINVVNCVVDTYGKPDEIRIELARELKKSIKERKNDIQTISQNATKNNEIINKIKSEFGFSHVSRNDIIRYKLYEELKENGYKTLYSGTYIQKEEIFSKRFDIEHIIPQSKLFDNSFSNKTLELREYNIEKSNKTAVDYIEDKWGKEAVSTFVSNVETLYKNGVISRAKYNKLLMKEADIPSGFIERDLRDTQYISKKAREILEQLVRDVVPTTGSITDRLRSDWQLIDVMKELNWDKFNKLNMTEVIEGRDGNRIYRIKDWSKRNDHRHHAMDAITVAFTKRSYIQYLNNLNARVGRDKIDMGLLGVDKCDRTKEVYGIESKELHRKNGKMVFNPPFEISAFRKEVKYHLQNILISNRANSKVTTKNINKIKSGGKVVGVEQLTPRGQLHNETIYGRISRYETKLEAIGKNFIKDKIETVAKESYRQLLLERLQEFGGDAKKAFTGKNSLDKNPIYIDSEKNSKLPKKVKTVEMVDIYTIRKEISQDLKVEKVIDKKVRDILKLRLKEYNNDPKKAFTNLDENPIWLNKEKGISIKRVTITAVSNAIPIHSKRDNMGNVITDSNGKAIPNDFVNTGNNHHIAIYSDDNGNLHEVVVSFLEATVRSNLKYPIVDREYRKHDGWKFEFSMKRNEYFVLPRYETVTNSDGEQKSVIVFDPNSIDLLDPANRSIISPNLFRVQKLASKYYCFRHHLETNVDDNKELRGIAWERITDLNNLKGFVKVRVNHIGQIVAVGEY